MARGLLFFLISARFCFDTDIGYINILLIVILDAKTQYHAIKATPTTEVALYLAYHLRGKQFADLDLVDFLSGSTDSAIKKFSGLADLHTPIHPPLLGCQSEVVGVLIEK